MRKSISKFAFTAGIVLALAFTLSCSSSDDPADGGGSTGGSVQFNEDPQVYNEDGSRFNGSGVAKWHPSAMRSCGKEDCIDTTINIMSVVNGIVKVELPAYPEKYPYNDGWLGGCKVSTDGIILSYEDDLPLYDSNEEYIGKLWLGYSDNGYQYLIFLLYSPKDAKVDCGTEGNLDIKAGWNKVYARGERCDKNDVCEDPFFSTDNFFTKPAKWLIEIND